MRQLTASRKISRVIMAFVLTVGLGVPQMAFAAVGSSDSPEMQEVPTASAVTVSAAGLQAAADDDFVSLEADLADSSRGTQEAPYRIGTEDDLIKFRQEINADVHAAGGSTDTAKYTGKYFKLVADVALTKAWVPVGTSSEYYFAGNFDGDGHTVSGISYSSAAGASAAYGGFFGYVKAFSDVSITIKNLKVVGAETSNADITDRTTASDSATGGIVGYAFPNLGTAAGQTAATLTIENCVTNVNLKGGSGNLGGIVGFANKNVHVKNTLVLGNIDASASENAIAGGIAGNYNTVDASTLFQDNLFLGQVTSFSDSSDLRQNALVGTVASTDADIVNGHNNHYATQNDTQVGAWNRGTTRAPGSDTGMTVSVPTTNDDRDTLVSTMGWNGAGTALVAANVPGNLWTVTFDSDGGSTVAAQNVREGKTATQPENPMKEGFIFQGWQLNGADYDFANPVNSNITLKAVWQSYDWDTGVWHGGLDFSWYDKSNPQTSYTIKTPEQWAALAWICSDRMGSLLPLGKGTYTDGNVVAIKGTVPMEQNTFAGVVINLDADLNMGGVKAADGTWSADFNYYPVGGSYQADDGSTFSATFLGSFDGKGHYVNNIYCDRGSTDAYEGVGLFGTVGQATTRNAATAGNITIKNVGVSGYIKSGKNAGGIVGHTLAVSSSSSVAIENCKNSADVVATVVGAGGICGNFDSAANPSIKNCYSLGTTKSGSTKGSIVANAEGPIQNVYSAESDFITRQLGSGVQVTNAYVLGPVEGNESSTSVKGTEKTDAEMRSLAFVDDLNGEDASKPFKVNCNGYPVLSWEADNPHTPASEKVQENVVAPLCEVDGHHDEVVYCSECDVELSRDVAVKDEKLGHVWDEGAVTTLPTIGKEGVKTFTCTRDSSHKRYESVAKVDPQPLVDAIAAANAARTNIRTSDQEGKDLLPDTKYTATSDRAALDNAISAAQAVADNPDSVQTAVDGAQQAVTQAKEAFVPQIETAAVDIAALTKAIKAATDAKVPNETTSETGRDLPDGTKYTSQAALVALNAAVAAAQEVETAAANKEKTQNQVDAATAAMDEARQAYEDAVQTAVVDKSGLNEDIAAAEADRDATFVSEDGYDAPDKADYVPQAVLDAFQEGINAAGALAADALATQDGVDQERTSLKDAKDDFDNAKKQAAVDRGPLNAAVAAAKADQDATNKSKDGSEYDPAILWANPASAESKALDNAIANGQKIAADPEASQKQADEAAAAAKDAQKAYDAAKKPGTHTDVKDSAATVASQAYTSYPVTPAAKDITVRMNGKTLRYGTDYTVSFSNNVEVGKKAVATIKGAGVYTGAKTVNFAINHKVTTKTFKDLKASAWYMNDAPNVGALNGTNTLYLDYVVARGIMSGYTDGKSKGGFGADSGITRGQVAVVLYRAHMGRSATTAENKVKTKFSDVKSGKYYTAAVKWATDNKIVTGYTGVKKGKFGPNEKVTREDMVTMVYRYLTQVAKSPVSGKALTQKDKKNVSKYAKPAMKWAVSANALHLRSGKTPLSPKAAATRAEAAQILAVALH